ncbi:MAG: hypothetical protein PHZ09_09965, partial [Eubacteriales bacterium]|nr:hypothetical protein [Eubacteriales bacterium]
GVVAAQCGVAWVVSLAVYQSLLFLDAHSGLSGCDIAIIASVLVLLAAALFYIKKRKNSGCAGCSARGDCAGCPVNTKQDKIRKDF